MQKSALSNPFKWRSSYTRALALRLLIREGIKRSNHYNMTKAMHQYSTIRSTKKSLNQTSTIDGLISLRPLLVQVEFEVFGDVSGMIFIHLLCHRILCKLFIYFKVSVRFIII